MWTLLLADYSCVWGLTCSVVDIPSETVEGLTFPLPADINHNSFLGRGGIVSISTWFLEFLWSEHEQVSCMLSHSL